MTRVLLTGATGFVGSAIALQLLGTEAHPVCLVRSRNQDSPQVRLEAALRTAAGAYGLALSTAQIARCLLTVSLDDDHGVGVRHWG
ncbi:MAG: NAD-dependent epimerase/dehydratase family protein [Mycobacterium sp.]|nr:MAG: NAD-dependent epimerase/dehydratase family protein [Mycobacterium sp.]